MSILVALGLIQRTSFGRKAAFIWLGFQADKK
jgi:hypothetical protein